MFCIKIKYPIKHIEDHTEFYDVVLREQSLKQCLPMDSHASYDPRENAIKNAVKKVMEAQLMCFILRSK